MPPTFLELLAERDSIAEKHAVLRLEQERQAYNRAVADAQTTQLLEDCWASSDPYSGGRAIPAGLGSAPNDLYHPGAIARHSARPGARRDGCLPPYYFTEMQHWMLVDAARTLEAFCPTATTILDILTQFAIFTGFTYTITDKNPPDVPEPSEDGEPVERPENPTVEAVQDALDKWQKEVDWYRWELEIFRRSRRDGEAFIVLDDDDPTTGGLVGLRSVEPEQVKEPQDRTAINGELGITGRDATWRYGILTTRRDTSKPLAYWVVSQYNDAQQQGEMYEADDMVHVKTEWVDRQSKRGVSDFFSVANDLPGVKKLLRNLREGATVQAAIAWIREHPPGMTVQPLGAGGQPITTRTGNSATGVQYDGPTMLDVSAGMKYTAGPLAGTGQSETLIQVLQAALRNIGARWQMPEGLVSGDASNANLASALVAEGPFTRALQARQWYYAQAYKRIIERVLDRAAVDGVIPGGENLLDEIEVSVDMPPVVARKLLEATQQNAILSDHGILGNTAWSAREDLDREEQRADIAADPIQPPSIMLGMEQQEESESDDMTNDANGERVT